MPNCLKQPCAFSASYSLCVHVFVFFRFQLFKTDHKKAISSSALTSCAFDRIMFSVFPLLLSCHFWVYFARTPLYASCCCSQIDKTPNFNWAPGIRRIIASLFSPLSYFKQSFWQTALQRLNCCCRLQFHQVSPIFFLFERFHSLSRLRRVKQTRPRITAAADTRTKQ